MFDRSDATDQIVAQARHQSDAGAGLAVNYPGAPAGSGGR
jgi:hypothetical protein